MTPDKKPEWFQLADADNSASIRKISKGLPIMALVAVAAIIGVGAIFAQPQEQTLRVRLKLLLLQLWNQLKYLHNPNRSLHQLIIHLPALHPS
jgi:hypothetical protein